jgi:predicted AAA+ superfamily ATPase
MLKRKITEYLEKWLNRNTVVLVDGVRQAGKSFAIRAFGKDHFGDNYFEFNFHDHEDVVPDFNKCKTASELITNLSYYSPRPFVPGKTLIFLDEIQLVDGIDWEMFSKYLVMDGRFRFALSGSLLGVTLNGLSQDPSSFKKNLTPLDSSHPGSALDEIRLFPLDFEEYLWACGLSEDAIKEIKEDYFKGVEVPSIPHKRLLDYFYEYLFVGGFPDAVNSFLKGRDLQELRLAHERIEKMHLRDITYHAEKNNHIHLLDIYESLSGQINSKDKRFFLNSVCQKKENYNIQDDFQWLVKAGLAYPVYNVTEPTIPLRLNEKRNLVKLFESDVGMLSYHLLDTDSIRKLLAKEKSINEGAIFENAVAQLLSTHGYSHLYYYDSKKHGEVDFLIEKEGQVLPLEIKSGKDYQIHRALTYFLSEVSPYAIPKAFVFSDGNVSLREKEIYYPIYMIDFLSK